MHLSKSKLAIIFIVCAFGLLFSLPNVLSKTTMERLPSWLQNTINLGLELRGGSHLQLEVDLKAAHIDHMTNLLDSVRIQLRKSKIGYKNLSLSTTGQDVSILLGLRKSEDEESLVKAIKQVDPTLQTQKKSDGRFVITKSPESLSAFHRSVIDLSIEVIRRRIDESGTKEPVIQRQGEDRIILQLAGVDDPSIVIKLLGKTAKLTFRMVNHNAPAPSFTESGKVEARTPSDSDLLPEVSKDDQGQQVIKEYLIVYKNVHLTGEHLVDAQATLDQRTGKPIVHIEFNSLGARKFGDLSTANVNKRLAMVLDNIVISAPNFSEPITGGKCTISGNFTMAEANNLALLLRAGALPAPLKVIEERTVGPSLGADSIAHGQKATIYAFVLIAVFMFLNYSLFGIFAGVALVFNIVLLFAALSLLQATLTLPGIAAIALTMGMAVDANVLIYERIREEAKAGARVAAAVEAGYNKAMTTILDSNLTTLAGAAVLFEFGSGPIRGFAVNLALGILISLFTALSLTKMIIQFWIKWRKPNKLSI